MLFLTTSGQTSDQAMNESRNDQAPHPVSVMRFEDEEEDPILILDDDEISTEKKTTHSGKDSDDETQATKRNDIHELISFDDEEEDDLQPLYQIQRQETVESFLPQSLTSAKKQDVLPVEDDDDVIEILDELPTSMSSNAMGQPGMSSPRDNNTPLRAPLPTESLTTPGKTTLSSSHSTPQNTIQTFNVNANFMTGSGPSIASLGTPIGKSILQSSSTTPAMFTPSQTSVFSHRSYRPSTTTKSKVFSSASKSRLTDDPVISVDLTLDSDDDTPASSAPFAVSSSPIKDETRASSAPFAISSSPIPTSHSPEIQFISESFSPIGASSKQVLVKQEKQRDIKPNLSTDPALQSPSQVPHDDLDNIVCMGLIYTYINALVPVHPSQVGQPALVNHPLSVVNILPDPAKGVLFVYDELGSYIGFVEPKVGNVIVKLLKKVTSTGYTNKIYATSASIYLQLLLYGQRKFAQDVWEAFRSKQIGVNQPPPTIPLAYKYLNPRGNVAPTSVFVSSNVLARNNGVGSSSSFVVRSTPSRMFNVHREPGAPTASGSSSGAYSDEFGADDDVHSLDNLQAMRPEVQNKVHSQIEQVYNALSAPEDIPQAEAHASLKSNLYKHQKQALYFMMLKEGEPDFEGKRRDGFGFHSLWKKNGTKYESIITGLKRNIAPTDARGGILADDMGLGKTIVTIALILTKRPNVSNDSKRLTSSNTHRANETPKQKSSVLDEISLRRDVFGFVKSQAKTSAKPSPALSTSISSSSSGPPPALGTNGISLIPSNTTLIVCPLSTVSNWEEQIQVHVEPDTLSVLVHHGPGRTSNPMDLVKYDVVITTYNILSMCVAPAKKKGDGHEEQTEQHPLSVLHKIRWFRIVLDEAHIIKNPSTAMSRSACSLSALNRWCLTGTPIQNKIEDIYALLKFLHTEPLNTKGNFQTFISMPLRNPSSSRSTVAVHCLQTQMKAITLRRTKTQKMDGKPILNLPEKTEEFREVELSEAERKVYDAIEKAALKEFREMEQEGALLANYMSLLERILRMRQACLHPSLCENVIIRNDRKGKGREGSNPNAPFTNERAKSRLLLLRDSGHAECGLCQQEFEQIANAETIDDNDTRLKITVTRCEHVFCWNCLKPARSVETVPCPLCSSNLTRSSDIKFLPLSTLEEEGNDEDHVSGQRVSVDGLDDDAINALFTEASTKVKLVIEELNQFKNESILTGQPVEKTIIFSQWTHMLNLMEGSLQEYGFKFVRLDGAMNRASRHEAMTAFRVDPHVTVFLISLKAGGVGLNLTSGSRVFILEPYWNPATESQAIDRVHRLGQTRPVKAVHLIVKNSIEERMLALQKHKMELARLTFNEPDEEEQGTNRKRKRISKDDDKVRRRLQRLNELKMLFGV